MPKLLEYLHIEERHLQTIAQELYEASARDILGEKYVAYIKRGESPQMNLVLLSWWMDSDMRDKWIRVNIKRHWHLVHQQMSWSFWCRLIAIYSQQDDSELKHEDRHAGSKTPASTVLEF